MKTTESMQSRERQGRKNAERPDIFLEISEADFEEQFQPVRNHLDVNACWNFDDNGWCMFQTYGKELDFVRQQDPRRVWTLIEAEDVECIVSGYHWVNRQGYFVTRVPLPEGMSIEVRID